MRDVKEMLTKSFSCSSDYDVLAAQTRVREDSELSEEFEVKVRMHQGSVLSLLLLSFVVDVVTELARVCVSKEMKCAD